MKITVKVDTSESVRHFTYDLSDYGITDEEWEKMSEEDRQTNLQGWVDDEHEQPFWVTDKYEEKY